MKAQPKVIEIKTIDPRVFKFLRNSPSVGNNDAGKIFLMDIIENYGRRIESTTMLYQGSVDGFTSVKFHRACDYQSPTISLFKVEDGPCIGGYT